MLSSEKGHGKRCILERRNGVKVELSGELGNVSSAR